MISDTLKLPLLASTKTISRDMVAAAILKLVPLRTHLMVADALTKSLPSPAHIKHRDIMLGHVPFAARTLRNSVGGG